MLKYTLWAEINNLYQLGRLEEGLASRLKAAFRVAGHVCSRNFAMMNSAGKSVKKALMEHDVKLVELQGCLLALAQLPVLDEFANATFSIYGL